MQVATNRQRTAGRLLGHAPKLAGGGLRNRIIAWAFVPTAIILATVGLISLYTYQRVTEELVIERDREQTRLSADQLAAELASYTDPLSERFLDIFDSGMVMLDAAGRVLAAEPETIDGLGAEWYRRYPFGQLARTGETTISDVVVDGPKGEKLIAAYVPILGRDGQPVGGIGGLFRLRTSTDNALYRDVEDLRRREDDAIYLVDGNGRVIYHSDPTFLGEDFADQDVVHAVLAGEVGSLRTVDRTGREIVASFAPVGESGWGLVTEQSWSALMQPVRRHGQLMFVLLALGVAVPTGLVAVGLRRIMRPVQELTQAAQAVAGGDFEQRITATTGDELEELAEQFNVMAVRLQESYDHLEGEVADRTKELATLNALATVVSRSLNLEEILNDALDQALDIMEMTKGQALLLDDETQELVQIAHRGLSEALVRSTVRLPLPSSTVGLATVTGSPLCSNVSEYREGPLVRLLRDEGIAVVISTPLMAKGRTVGAIDLCSEAQRTVSAEQLSLLAAIGHQIGVAVENARLYEQAQQVAVLEERSRLARDLHDAVTQTLFSASLLAQTLPAVWEENPDDGRTLLQELRRLSRAALAEMRALLLELRPAGLCEVSLDHLLRQLAESVTGRSGMRVHVVVEGQCRLPDEAHVALYRIAQEALNNVVKHAQASQVTATLHCVGGSCAEDQVDAAASAGPEELRWTQRVELQVCDDGRGFELDLVRPGELGLRIMRERAAAIGATLEIASHPGQGTCISVSWEEPC
jgi:nitrate/nitrite-specific signal transduction histidine kinase